MSLLIKIYFKALFVLLRRPPHPRVLINYFFYHAARVFKLSSLFHTPVSVVYYASKSCNLNCSFCFAAKDLNRENGDLTLEQFQALSHHPYLKNALRVGLLGGEPFMAPEIFEILALLQTQRNISTIVTNSLLLNESKLDLLAKYAPDILGLSLYKTNRDAVSKVYQRMVPHCIVWIQTIISSDRLEKIEETIEYCLSIGCTNLRLSNYYPRSEDDHDLVIFSDHQQYATVKSMLKRRYRWKINIDWLTPISRDRKRRNCLQPISYIHLDHKGAIGPCFMRPPSKERYGSIFDSKGWNHQNIVALRNTMNNADLDCDPSCLYCENLESDLYKI